MDGERIARALSRIEAATARIESAAALSPRAPAGDPELERKYSALRSETAAALQELDQVIGALEQ